MERETKRSTGVAECLLDGVSVGVEDAARIVLEIVEGVGGKALSMGRYELMHLLRRVVSEGVEALRRQERTVTVREAVQACVEFKAKYVRPATLRDLRHFTARMLRVEGFGERPLRAVGVQECRYVLEAAFGASRHSFRKGRAIMHGLFAFGYRREWCGAENPVDHIDPPHVEEREIVPLRVDEVERLFRATERPEHADMRLSVYLMVYCGVRPAEVERMRPDDVDLGAGVVRVRSLCSKTGGGRVIPLRKAGLLRHRKLCIRIPHRWQERWRSLRRAAGFRCWVPDVLRHTFASYHAARFGNLPQLQAEMGHGDLSLLRTRYVNLTALPARQVGAFWD